MGTESVWVPLAIAAVSAGAQYYNTQQTARKQDNALAEQIRNQAAQQREADARVAKAVQDTAASNPDAARTDALDQYVQQLRRHQEAATGNLNTPVGASQAFRQDAADAALGVKNYGDQFANLMSRIDAPAIQRQQEAFNFGDLSTDIAGIKRNASGQDFLDELRLRSIRRNPWIDAGSQIGMAYALGAAGKGG